MNGLAVVKSIVLARLLVPEMFGLMGLCAIVIGAIETFTRPGIGQALIQRQSSFEEARDTAFTLLLARGAILATLLILIAPFAANFYDAGELEPMLNALSITFLLGGFININTIARQKELDFRQLTLISQTSAFLGTLITLIAAYAWRNVWALVVGHIATATLHMLLSYYFIPGKPRIRFNKKISFELLSYSKFITASSIVLFVATHIDTAVIGKALGTASLGYYVLAFTFANLVTANISKLASAIMMPAYSQLQGDMPALRGAYLNTLTLVAFVTFPAAIGVIVTAEHVVQLVYGSKWAPAVPALQILLGFGLLRSIASVNGYVFEGVGKPQIPLYASVMRLAVLAPLIVPISVYFGLPGAAAAVTFAMMTQCITFMFFTRREIGVSVRATLSSLTGPFWKSTSMGLFVYALSAAVDGAQPLGLVILISSGVLVYSGLNYKFIRGLRHSLSLNTQAKPIK